MYTRGVQRSPHICPDHMRRMASLQGLVCVCVCVRACVRARVQKHVARQRGRSSVTLLQQLEKQPVQGQCKRLLCDVCVCVSCRWL